MAASFLAALLAWLALAAWLRRDARAHRVALGYDWAWLMTLGWPVSYVWYGRRTLRSWGKCSGLAGLPAAFLLGGFLACMIVFFFH